VQVASYKSEKSAQREVDALRQKGFKEVYALTKGKYVIVCVGKFDSKTGARLFTEKLKSRYQDTSVRSL
jgi:phosphoheptose isomerase